MFSSNKSDISFILADKGMLPNTFLGRGILKDYLIGYTSARGIKLISHITAIGSI